MRTPKTITALAALTLALAACSPGEELAERMLESEEGIDDVEIDIESGEFSVEGEDEDGSVSIGGGEIPDDFPIDVPGGGEIVSVAEAGPDTVVAVRWEEGFDSIRSFYEDWTEDNGEVVSMTEFEDGDLVNWIVEDGDRSYSIQVANARVFIQATLVATMNN